MTFPLKANARSSSLLFNLATGCARLPEPVELTPMFFAIEALARSVDMSPGSPDELNDAFDAICKGSISPQDDLIRQSFAQFLKTQQKRRKTTLPFNLEEALGNLASKELPPYQDFMRAITTCFHLTGLTGDSEEWTRILKRHYSIEMKSDDKFYLDLCFYLQSNCIDEQSPQEKKQFIDQMKKCHKEQIRVLSDVLNCPLKKRLEIVLKIPPSATDDSRAEFLQNVCNVLLRENYLLKKISELCRHLQKDLQADSGCVIQIGEIAQTLRAMGQSNEEPIENEFCSIALSIMANDLINEAISQKMRLVSKSFAFEEGILAGLNSDHFFSRFDRVFRYIDEVEKRFCGHPKKEELTRSAIRIRRSLRILISTFRCDNAKIYCLDITKRILALKRRSPRDDKSISPLNAAFMYFNFANCNLEKGKTDPFEMIDFFSKVISIYLDNQKKQGMVYKKAHSMLCELIDRQSPKNRRYFFKYKKIDMELPIFEKTLPDQLEPFAIESFHDSKKAMKSDEREVETYAKFADRQILPPSPQGINGSAKKRAPSASRLEQKQPQAPLAPIRKEPVSRSDRTEPLHLLDLPKAAPFPFSYDGRVARWFTASVPLDRHVFSRYSHATPHYQNKMIDLHAFSPLADYFCNHSYRYNPPEHFGKETTCHILPAELTRGSSSERGYILWAIDRVNCCYHRFFHIDKSPFYYDKLVRRTFHEADFPELSRAREEQPTKITPLDHEMPRDAGNVNIELDELLRILTIHELDKGTCLKIFIGKSDSAV